MTTADDIIKELDLAPHPEGGYYRRTHQTEDKAGGRGLMTAIYYLLKGGDFALWHKVDADELWLWHRGAPLVLEIQQKEAVPQRLTKRHTQCHTLGPDVLAGERPQVLIPANQWQRAKSLGDYTLVSCAVSPGFTFETYDLAENGFDSED